MHSDCCLVAAVSDSVVPFLDLCNQLTQAALKTCVGRSVCFQSTQVPALFSPNIKNK